MAEQNSDASGADAEDFPPQQLVEYFAGPHDEAGDPDPLLGSVDEHGDVDTSCFLDRSEQQSPRASRRGMSPATAPLGYLDGNEGMWKLWCRNCGRSDAYTYLGGDRGFCEHCGGNLNYVWVATEWSPAVDQGRTRATSPVIEDADDLDGGKPDADFHVPPRSLNLNAYEDPEFSNDDEPDEVAQGQEGSRTREDNSPLLPTVDDAAAAQSDPLVRDLESVMDQFTWSSYGPVGRITKRKQRPSRVGEELDGLGVRHSPADHDSPPGKRIYDRARGSQEPMYGHLTGHGKDEPMWDRLFSPQKGSDGESDRVEPVQIRCTKCDRLFPVDCNVCPFCYRDVIGALSASRRAWPTNPLGTAAAIHLDHRLGYPVVSVRGCVCRRRLGA